MNSVMISIKPEWSALIASGEKTAEVRKTKPSGVKLGKLAEPFKCYIYETQGRTDTPWVDEDGHMIFAGRGQVIGEFVCDCVTPLYNVCTDDWKRLTGGLHRIEKELVNQACLTEAQLHTYAGGKNCFAWHISNLKIYDTPKELIEFHTWKKCKSCSKSGYESTACIYDENCMIPAAITKAPQSWCYVEVQKGD